MPTPPVNIEIDRLTERINRLAHRSIATHAAACGERLIEMYLAYARKDNGGRSDVVRNALDAAWGHLDRHVNDVWKLSAAIEALEVAIPHGDDCESVECVLALYPCICIDTALRYCLDDSSVGPVAVEYAIEGLRKLWSHLETGYIDLGSGPQADAFEATLIDAPVVRDELKRQEEDLRVLESTPALTASVVKEIRRRAVANRLDVAELLA